MRFSIAYKRETNMRYTIAIVLTLLCLTVFSLRLGAYPPAVGILGEAKNCLSCHIDDGPWEDDGTIIVDIVDKETRASLKQADGSFLIKAKRGEMKTVTAMPGFM
jgi:hypothetical protein